MLYCILILVGEKPFMFLFGGIWKRLFKEVTFFSNHQVSAEDVKLLATFEILVVLSHQGHFHWNFSKAIDLHWANISQIVMSDIFS